LEADEYALMDAAEDHMWWYRALHVRLLDRLAGIDGPVLDAGCGTGGLLAKLFRAHPALTAIGVEWSAEGATRAARKSPALIVRGDINALPLADASFAAAVSADVLCHQAVHPQRALAELHRVLQPGGLLVINMPAYRWLTSAHDLRVHNARRQTATELLAMLRDAGFSSPEASYWNALLLPLMVIQRKLLANHGDSRSDVAPFPPWLDAILYGVTTLERRIPLAMPAGGSVLATARKLP